MIKSPFVRDVVELLLESSDISDKIRESMLLVSDIEYEYTGAGVFMTFGNPEHSTEFDAEAVELFDGLTIDSPELENGAEAMISIKGDKISSLEIWSHSGEYPKRDLLEYVLPQELTESQEKSRSSSLLR